MIAMIRTGKHNYRSQVKRPRKADKGHSVVKVETWTRGPVLGMDERRAITCECGKRYTGNGDRAWYSHTAHLRDVGVVK